eukprot:6209782-Pleurochrysis_carterae.AAC.1
MSKPLIPCNVQASHFAPPVSYMEFRQRALSVPPSTSSSFVSCIPPPLTFAPLALESLLNPFLQTLPDQQLAWLGGALLGLAAAVRSRTRAHECSEQPKPFQPHRAVAMYAVSAGFLA